MVFSVLIILAVGCAPLTAQQQADLAEVRAFVATVIQVYGLPPVPVRVEEEMGMRAATYKDGIISISPRTLRATPWRDVILAHEVAHHLLGHDGPLGLGWDGESQVQQRELDADAKAVEILQRVRGLTENEAFRLVYDAHWSLQRAVGTTPFVVPLGHPAPCVKLADLIKRFPAQQAWARAC
ncbi:MAG TPA: hypothetical protein VJP78_11420 [Thermoleophilia bacterium]|nr:hypothetical protein [Thermoleophilia bacterium]